LDGILVPDEAQEIVPVGGAWAALEDRFHIFETVEGAPRPRNKSLSTSHPSGKDDESFMLGIIKIEVRVHPLAAAQHVEVVHGAGQGHKDEERGVVRTDLVHEKFQIAADGFDSVKGEADDVADVRGNF